MPQTYIRTLPGVIGTNNSFSPVSELWIRIVFISSTAKSCKPLARLPGSHRLHQGGKLGTVRAAGQSDTQGHVQLGTLAARRRTAGGGDRRKIIAVARGSLGGR